MSDFNWVTLIDGFNWDKANTLVNILNAEYPGLVFKAMLDTSEEDGETSVHVKMMSVGVSGDKVNQQTRQSIARFTLGAARMYDRLKAIIQTGA